MKVKPLKKFEFGVKFSVGHGKAELGIMPLFLLEIFRAPYFTSVSIYFLFWEEIFTDLRHRESLANIFLSYGFNGFNFYYSVGRKGYVEKEFERRKRFYKEEEEGYYEMLEEVKINGEDMENFARSTWGKFG